MENISILGIKYHYFLNNENHIDKENYFFYIWKQSIENGKVHLKKGATDIGDFETVFLIQNKLKTYIQETETLSNGGGDISDSSLYTLVQCLIFIFKGTIMNSLTREELDKDLKTCGLSTQYASLVSKAFFQYARESLLENLGTSADSSASKMNLNAVKDLEWRFGVTVSSSEMAKVGKPNIQMKIRIEGREKPVYLELNVDQFYEFLHEMEKAKTLADMMSG